MKIYIIGLGAGSIDLISKKAYELLKNDNIKKIFRTSKHEIVDSLIKENIIFESTDFIYEQEKSFEDVYEKISDYVIDYVKKYDEIIYAVPGSPFITEDTTNKIIEKARKEDIKIQIIPSVSFIDASMCAIQKDPTKQLYITDIFSIDISKLNPNDNILISQVYDTLKASQLKVLLLEVYDDDQEIYLISSCGGENEKIEKIKLYEMDYKQYEYNHLTSIFIEKVDNKKYKNIYDLKQEIEKKYENNSCLEELKMEIIENMEKSLKKLKNNEEYIEDEIPQLLSSVIILANIAIADGVVSFEELIDGAVKSIK